MWYLLPFLKQPPILWKPPFLWEKSEPALLFANVLKTQIFPSPSKKNAFGQSDCNNLSKLFLKNKLIN